MSLGERIVSICRLPDGRVGVQNERDLSDLTADDVQEIEEVFGLWLDLHYRRRAGEDAEGI